MSIKSKIETDVRSKQRGIRVRSGDQFWRGGRFVLVTAIKPNAVTFKDLDSGERETVDRRVFYSRALVRAPDASGLDTDPLRQAWAIVGLKSLSFDYRLRAARAFAKQASDPKVKGKITTWMYALSANREPKK